MKKGPAKGKAAASNSASTLTRNKSQVFGCDDGDDRLPQPASNSKSTGLLFGLKRSDVSDSRLQEIVSKANSPQDLFGVVSSAEMIDLIFLWFGAGNLDVDWYHDTARGRQRSILPSPHNRAIQD